MAEPWREVGDGVLVRRHASFDLNVGLVVGDGACLVVDTRCSLAEGRDLVDAVRRVTAAPWQVVATHAHFDHVGFAERARTELGVPVHVHENDAPLTRHPWRYDHERPRSPYFATQVRAMPIVAALVRMLEAGCK